MTRNHAKQCILCYHINTVRKKVRPINDTSVGTLDGMNCFFITRGLLIHTISYYSLNSGF